MPAEIIRFGKIVGKPEVKDANGKLVIGPKRMAELKRLGRNYERRVKNRVRKYFGEVTIDNVNKLMRAEGRSNGNGMLYMTYIDVNNIKSVKAYNKLVKALTRDKSPDYKTELKVARREWMKDMISNAYDFDINDFPALRDVIDKMSADDILRWQTRYPKLVRDIGYHYEYGDRRVIDRNWLEEMNAIIASINDITGAQIPSMETMIGY